LIWLCVAIFSVGHVRQQITFTALRTDAEPGVLVVVIVCSVPKADGRQIQKEPH
jgi:hypothetical protein